MLKPALQVLPPCICLSQCMDSGKPFGFQGETPNSTNLICIVGDNRNFTAAAQQWSAARGRRGMKTGETPLFFFFFYHHLCYLYILRIYCQIPLEPIDNLFFF